MTRRILRNTLCAEVSPARLEQADVRIEDGTITEVGRGLAPVAGEEVDDLRGALLVPGFVCAHTHLYSSLARGMPGPPAEPDGFIGILNDVWWKLDRALDAESIYYSAAAGALEALRCGVTTLVDHHASPNAIAGSLSLIEQALGEVGIRGILCYETSDRDGPRRRDEGLEENDRFLASRTDNAMVRALVGAHASFTLSDDSLRLLGEIAARHGTGVHVHVAEDRADAVETRRLFGSGILERFEHHGLVRRDSVFAHALHLDDAGYAALRERGPWLVHNPRSNMNNRVGHAPLHRFGPRSALGTDGFPADMLEEVRTAFFKDRESEQPAGPDFILRLLQNGHELVSEVFRRPFGRIRPGAAADLVVLEYASPTPMTAENLPGHILFGLRSSMVDSVMVGGGWVLRHRRHERLREDDLLRRSTAAAAQLWRAMHG